MSSSGQTSTSTSTCSTTLSRSTLSSDITQLLHLQSSASGPATAALNELLDPFTSQRDINLSTAAADTPAEVLKSFSSSLANKNPTSSDAPSQTQAQTTHTSEHEQSQRLVKAYISSMENMKRLQASGQVDGVGQRIDKLRESAEGISGVLGEVRI